jgi:hypothetical protein
MSENVKFVQGNEACAEAALYAGLDFYAGYPITPSSEITEYLAYCLPQIGGKFMQMEDEIASLCAIIGASLTGSKVMTATSGPGFSLMQEQGDDSHQRAGLFPDAGSPGVCRYGRNPLCHCQRAARRAIHRIADPRQPGGR